MAFDNVPMTRKPVATMTATAALAAYDTAIPRTFAEACALAEMLAAALRAAPKPKAPPKPKPTGFRVDLLAALKLVNKVIERRNTVPILSDVLLEASGDVLTIRATDLDMELQIAVPAPGIGTWTTTAGGKALADVIGKGKGDILLAPCPETGRLEVMVGEAVTALPSLDPEDFPLFSAPKYECAFETGAAPFAEMLRFIRPAVSTEETRYYLNGVYLHTVVDHGAARLRVVATDGHRLNLDDMAAPEGMPMFAGVIVPRKAVDVVTAVLTGQESVRIEVSPQSIRFTSGAVTLLSKVVDGAFPDYMRVVPRDLPQTFALDTAAFVGGVKQVLAISQEKSRSIGLDFADGKVRLSAKNMESGVAEMKLPAPHTGTDGEIGAGFNGSYLVDACEGMGADRIQLSLSHPDSPAVVRSEAYPTRTTVIMPLRR